MSKLKPAIGSGHAGIISVCVGKIKKVYRRGFIGHFARQQKTWEHLIAAAFHAHHLPRGNRHTGYHSQKAAALQLCAVNRAFELPTDVFGICSVTEPANSEFRNHMGRRGDQIVALVADFGGCTVGVKVDIINCFIVRFLGQSQPQSAVHRFFFESRLPLTCV